MKPGSCRPAAGTRVRHLAGARRARWGRVLSRSASSARAIFPASTWPLARIIRRGGREARPAAATWPEAQSEFFPTEHSSLLPQTAPLPSDPPAEARLYDADDIPVAQVGDSEAVAYDPDPRPFSERGMRMALPIDRERWDELRLANAEYKAADALGGSALSIWTMAQTERAHECVQTGVDPGPPAVPVWMDQALPDWVRRRRLEE